MEHNMPKFLFNLHQTVELGISGEQGYIKGRAEYLTSGPQYFVHYKAADGRAVSAWFDEEDLTEITE